MFWYHENSEPEESSSSNFTEKETEAWKKKKKNLVIYSDFSTENCDMLRLGHLKDIPIWMQSSKE